MTDPSDTGEVPAARLPKPRAVSTAVLLALAIAAIGLVQGVNALLERRHIEYGLTQVGQYMATENAIYRTVDLRGSLVLAITLGFVALAVYAPMAVLLSLGKRWGRVLTWLLSIAVIIGELVLMVADSAAVKTGKFVQAVDVPGGDPNVVSMLNQMLVPTWFPPVHYVAEFGALLCLFALCIQLGRPAVAEYFRKEPPDDFVDERVWTTTRRATS